MAPAIQISEPPAHERSSRMEHKRWKSDPEKTRRDMAHRSQASRDRTLPYSYEYHFDREGRVVLKEYHGDLDFAHYSARRSPAATMNDQSSSTSREDLRYPAATDARISHSSHGSHAPPPSPRKGDALKRALTLHSLKRRASSEVKKTPPPSPYSPRPEIEKLAASFGRKGPQHITSPLPTIPTPKPDGMFEMPRAAPRPPSRDTPKPSPQPEPSPILSNCSITKDGQTSSHDFALRPRLPPTPPRSPMVDQFPLPPKHETISLSSLSMQSRPQQFNQPPSPVEDDTAYPTEDVKIENAKAVKRHPPLRRKGSKFIDHIERKEKLSPRIKHESEDIPPVPPMVFTAVEFNHPINGAVLRTPLPAGFRSPKASPEVVPNSPPVGTDSPSLKWEQSTFLRSGPSPPTISITKAESPVIASVETMGDPAIQRSSSVMRPLPPTPNRKLGRSNTTASRPTPKMSDVCMAQVKPVLTSGIIAQGHARMISC